MRSAARLWLIVVPAGLLAGAGALAFSLTSDHQTGPAVLLVLSMLIGWAFIAAGLLARTRRPDNRMGLLLIAVGFTWFLSSLSGANDSNLWTLGYVLGALWAAVFVHALLAYPSGRLGATWERAVVIGGYLLAGLAEITVAIFEPDPASCSDCPANAILISDNHTAATVALTVVQVLAVVFLLSVAILLVVRWRAATAVARRLLGPVLLAGGTSIALLAISIGLEPASETTSEVVAIVAAIAFLAVPFLFLSGLLRSRLARAAVGRMLVEMPEGATPEEAQDNLRRALGDPSLELLYWLPDRDVYVDVHGSASELPEADSARAVTSIEYEDRVVAALVHDPTLRDEPELVEAVVAAARVTIERDRLQAELRAKLDELQRERDFIREVVDAAPSYFAVLDPEGNVIRFNETLAAAIGRTDDETVRGQPFWEVFAKADEADELRQWFATASRRAERGEHEARMEGPKHDLVTAWTITPVTDESGDPRFLLGGLDLTMRIRQQEALRASDQRSRALLEAVPDNIYRVSREDGRFLDIRWTDPTRLPVPAERFIGATIHDIGLPPEIADRFLTAADKAFATGQVQELEYEVDVAGLMLHLDARIVPSGDEEYLVIVRDVTDRKRAEAAVERQRDFLSAMGDATPSLLAVVGTDGQMSEDPINHALRELTGLTADEAGRRVFWELVSAPEDAVEAERVIRTVTETRKAISTETQWLARGGERRLVAWTCTPLPIVDPGREFHLVSGIDITERARQEKEQAALRRVAVAVASDRRTEHVFDLVTEEVGRLLDAHSANVVRFEPEAEAMVILGQWSEPGVFVEEVGSTIHLQGGPLNIVYDTGRPVRVDLDEDRVPAPLADRLRNRGVSSVVAAPIIVSGNLWGAVTVSMMVPHTFPLGSEERIGEFTRLVSLALANEEAHEQLAASRARIVEAGDAERRRLERNLHDGAQQRLVALSLSLRLAQAKLAADPKTADELLSSASVELALALEELRELARGIHPAVLTERGLGPALESLADRAPVSVELECLPEERLPGPVEAAAFYVVSEALANVAKYAEASFVRVSIERLNGRAVVEVADDGKGGADPGRGSGLRGLVDRVEALDGRLAVESPPGAGTCVRAEIPLG
jgi:PAS domain S-box-containing protein